MSAIGGAVVTGLGGIVVAPGDAPADPSGLLKVRKNRKFMGVQDDLAVIAAGRALRSAGLPAALGERAGLYLAVGYIPFEERDVEALVTASIADGTFSMERFSTEGFAAVNPLLTFRCLPNMPAFHVSINFDLQGPYFVTYPGASQAYVALEEAHAALDRGEIDVALFGGVAHQQNFLVAHHFARLEPATAREGLRDAAGFLVIERADAARARGAAVRARCREIEVSYAIHDPFDPPAPLERLDGEPVAVHLGPASLPAMLAARAPLAEVARHEVRGADGIVGKSTWELPRA